MYVVRTIFGGDKEEILNEVSIAAGLQAHQVYWEIHKVPFRRTAHLDNGQAVVSSQLKSMLG